jgi:hypothetical protein
MHNNVTRFDVCEECWSSLVVITQEHNISPKGSQVSKDSQVDETSSQSNGYRQRKLLVSGGALKISEDFVVSFNIIYPTFQVTLGNWSNVVT